MNLPILRSLNQQLISPQYRTPEEVLAWMGMIQAQNFGAAKMALAMRMKCSSLEKALAKVDEALDRGTYALMDERVENSLAHPCCCQPSTSI